MKVYVVDADSKLVSTLYVKDLAQVADRTDIVNTELEAPEPLKGHFIKWTGTDWVQVPTPNSDAIPVSKDTLRNKRDELEASPVLANGAYFDVDSKSLKRIEGAIENFTALTGSSGVIAWTLADNTEMDLSKQELLAVKQAFVNRAFLLHQKYKALKNMNPLPTREQVWDPAFWLT